MISFGSSGSIAAGGEAHRLATRPYLRLFVCQQRPSCCMCRNVAHNQLQPLVEPQPSQT